jgi:hypothetical protein
MTWVGWRLQRTETLLAAGILALVAVLVVPTGLSMAHAYHDNGLASCLHLSGDPVCREKIGEFRQRFESLLNIGGWFTLVPGLIGALLAAPFVLDLEHGTYRLVWTQSITRGRWLTGKLGAALLIALLAAGGLTLLVTWWRTPAAHLDGRLDNATFDNTGVVVFGYTLFALGLALAVGAVWKRAAGALTVGFVGYFAARILVEYKVRDHLLTPLKATWKARAQPAALDHALVLSQQLWVNGHEVGRGGGGFLLGGTQKLAAPGNVVVHATYLPASDFWPLQLAEAGIYVGAAALLIGFAVWWTRKRIA